MQESVKSSVPCENQRVHGWFVRHRAVKEISIDNDQTALLFQADFKEAV
jgi:hypothetical protein